MRHELDRRPAPDARRPRREYQAARPILRAAGAASGALGASVAGQSDIAIGLLVLTALALAGDLAAAILRDQTFRTLAGQGKPDPQVLRELSIREAIRTGQLSSEDAATVLVGDPPAGQSQKPLRTLRRPLQVTAVTRAA